MNNKSYISIILAVLIFFSTATFSLSKNTNHNERPKVGLVLSGGGAKGFAHIGILKMLDSLKMPIDYVAGTSMGGIIGALYAIGFSGQEIENMVHRNDWEEILTDLPPRKMLPYFQKTETGKFQLDFGLDGVKPVTPSGLIYGQKICLLFSSLTLPYEHITDFNDLPVPFRCVAIDLVTGNEVVLKKGSLAKAMRSTMAIPSIFSPVEWGDSLLVDGGLMNNLPINVIKDMGADIVIAVDVESPLLERDELGSVIDVLNQTILLLGIERKRKNLKLVDLIIRPNLDGFTIADFDNEKIKQIIQRGINAARKNLPHLNSFMEKYDLLPIKYQDINYFTTSSTYVKNIQITGYKSVPYDVIKEKLQFKTGDRFDPNLLYENLCDLKTSLNLKSARYEVVPLAEDQIKLVIHIKENEKPMINRISIEGNRSLPFTFIYRLLGFKPGDIFDTQRLNRQIMKIYSLGYFEYIQYNIEPVDDKMVNLFIDVKELPLRRLRVGLRYDDMHRLVAVVNAKATNILLAGLRLESEFQFAGLKQFKSKAFYPSRALNLPIYPFINFFYRDIPTHIFDLAGNRIASYKDRSGTISCGLGFLLLRSFNTEIAYQYESLNIKPSIASADPDLFPTWNDKLSKISGKLNIDILDDVLLPKNGFLIDAGYEISLKKLKSDTSYQRLMISSDMYWTIQRHTFRLFSFFGTSSDKTPVYKLLNLGRPNMFVGLKYDQLVGNRMTILRFDYRYRHKKDIFFKLIGNMAFDIRYRSPQFSYDAHNVYGFGFGVTLLSPIGPIEMILARGDRGFVTPRDYHNSFYFTMGYKF